MRGLDPIRANLRRIINLSVDIVRVCGRSSNLGTSGFGTAVPQPALRGLLDAPLEAGQDNPRDRRIINISAVIVRVCGRSSNLGISGFGTAVPRRALRG